MKILVIEDAQRNVESAYKTLGEHDLTVLASVEEAAEIAWTGAIGKFDAVLTDLYLPTPEKVPNYCPQYGVDDIGLGDQIPAGLAFALIAVSHGIEHVGILTDSDHHRDRMCALLDGLIVDRKDKKRGQVVRGEARYFNLNTARDENGKFVDPIVKDWGKFLRCVIEGGRR